MAAPLAQPYLSDPRIFHIGDFTHRGRDLAGLRVTVVGGGQSGAEAFLDLINRPEASCRAGSSGSRVGRTSSRSTTRRSPTTTTCPITRDYFASLPMPVRQTFNAQHLLTSDGISESTLRAIYQRIYSHHYIQSRPDLVALYPNRDCGRGWPPAPGQRLRAVAEPTVSTRRLVENLDTDVIVFATGFRPHPMTFLAPLRRRIQTEGGEYLIDQHYAAHAGTDRPTVRCSCRTPPGVSAGWPTPICRCWPGVHQRILDRLTNTAPTPAPVVHRMDHQTAHARLGVSETHEKSQSSQLKTQNSKSSKSAQSSRVWAYPYRRRRRRHHRRPGRSRDLDPFPGADVTVLDRDTVGGGASRRSAGLHFLRGGTDRVRAMSQYSRTSHQ